MPLVPLASQGRRGVLIQTSTPCDQTLCQVHVVVTEEDHMGAGLGPPGKANPFLNQRLPRLVCRMRLAGQDELHGRCGFVKRRSSRSGSCSSRFGLL